MVSGIYCSLSFTHANEPRLTGGPGCSSLAALITENGPFTWEDGTLGPVQNSYSWTNLTNVIWVENPVGVGYSQGIPNITNEVELATEFRGFWKNFISTFGMEKFDMYITGESYAGVYVPYIADSFISAKDTDHFNLKGVAINNPFIGESVVQQQGIETIHLPIIAPANLTFNSCNA